MNNNLILKDTNIVEQIKNNIKDDLSKIKLNFKKNILVPLNLYNLEEHLTELKSYTNFEISDIIDLITIDYLFFFRIVLINSNSVRLIILEILRNGIKIKPQFTSKILDAMIPILICKNLEDIKQPFEIRYSCLKLIQTWLKLSDQNFPIIFLQSIAAIAKIEDSFKIGCIEFLRMTSISRPDLVSTVDGFHILINSLIDENLPKDLINKIIFSLIYIINTPNKSKYFNGFPEFYKIFSIFTKSDFSFEIQNNIEVNNSKGKEDIRKENDKLEKKLDLIINIIIKFLYSWTGFFLIMRDKLIIKSLLIALNNDVNIIIKKAILKLFKSILDLCNNIHDNYKKICSENKDVFYINKIYIAYIIKEIYSNNLNEHLLKFMEEIDSEELRNYSSKLMIKYNVFFTKVLNNDLRSTFTKEKIEELKWFEDSRNDIDINSKEITNNEVYHNEHILDYFSSYEKQKSPIQIKIMHLIDVVFHHLECKDTPFLTPQTISSEIIIAMNCLLNLDLIKKYDNQYSIESAKEEIYSKDEEYIQIIRNTKILELREFQQWDWTMLDSLFDIIEVRKDIIPELNRQKIFKKLLFVYSPSKNLIVKLPWIVNNFFYGGVGRRLFKILSDTPDNIEILDSPNEDTIFMKSNSWIKDVIQCLDEIFEKSDNEEHPFHIKKINNTLSRNIFIFIGIISNSKIGDDYLNKQGFYSGLNKFITKSNKFDYLMTLIIDNLNFNTKQTINLFQKIIENGNNEIKIYILNHIRCLLIFGKEVNIDIKFLLNALNQKFQPQDEIIVAIIQVLLNKMKNNYLIFKEKNMIEKVSQVDKSLLYHLMSDDKIFNYLYDIIQKEMDKLDVEKVVDEYAKEMQDSMNNIFDINDEYKNKFYLNINLADIYDRYSNYYEYFWIKQLPMNLVVQKIENNDKRYEYLLNNYLQYNSKENIIQMISTVQEPQKIIIDKNTGIQIICFLGRITLNKNCNAINNASNFLAFSYTDLLKSMVPYNHDKNIFIIKKDCINIILIQNTDKISYFLDKIFFNIRIRPSPIRGLKLPFNLITEVINSEKGIELLEEKKIIEKLLNYFDDIHDDQVDKNSSKIKSALYILSQILLKKNSTFFNNKYKIIQKISSFYRKCSDYSMKGTIIYLTSFIAQNADYQEEVINCNASYFSNSSIYYPNDSKLLIFDNSNCYENDKLEDDMDIIESKIELNSNSEEIYDNVTNLINNITSGRSVKFLESIINKKEKQFLMDVNLFIKIYAALSKYKFKLQARKFIMDIFTKSIYSSRIAMESMHLIKNLGDNLLNSGEVE